ncbi:protein FAM151B isoform X2 [Pseudophryne corroboree]|uniref:protein FAM151B isoform X2 n=1 Tax=Pseudophryne corroboree TaxID=495146 RepID=UPI003081C701
MPVVRRRVSVCTWSWMRKSLTCSKSCPCVTCIVLLTAGALITYYQLCCAAPPSITMDRRRHGPWSDNILDYFLSKGLIKAKDGSEIVWDHAVNSQEKLREALQSDVHMIEADVLLRGSADREPIMAHPPETDSDITLKDWLAAVSASNKGIKLDFKSLDAVSPSMKILDTMKNKIEQPVWINADILAGPGGIAKAVDAGEFMQMVTSSFPDVTLSLGWTTGWHPQKNNKGYSWEMVQEMEKICKTLSQPVTFPVRAALVRQSWPQLQWLLQTSDRYSLTVWTGKDDIYPVGDLLYIREHSEKHRIFYDVFEPQNSEFKKAVQQ